MKYKFIFYMKLDLRIMYVLTRFAYDDLPMVKFRKTDSVMSYAEAFDLYHSTHAVLNYPK